MKQKKGRKYILTLAVAGVLAAEILLLIDAAIVCLGETTPLLFAAGLFAVLLVPCAILAWKKKRWAAAWTIAIPLVIGLTVGMGAACWSGFSRMAVYESRDAGKHQIYGNRKVMVVVPHQDDELNILGGVMEEYARYGSEVYPVFITNGDYYGLAETRFREARAVLHRMGIPQDNAVFLGYGDSWQTDGPHIYNAASGEVVTSQNGNTATYGTQVQGVYRENRSYTIDHLMEDLKSVILEYVPDVIFCSDYDHHIDHKATTLLFDKVMGQILKENPAYQPAVYKAYAYGTAWEAEADFYEENILSTKNLFDGPYGQNPAVYHWEERVRFPVQGDGLSRSLLSTEGYALLCLHESQDANLMAAAVVNGDKVAWQRYTDSLCLQADITATSGQAGLINDFMLIENHHLVDENHKPYDGVWIPEAEDGEKTITVVLQEAAPVSEIVLYDHPSQEHNVRNAVISFDDGTAVETGPLDAGGAATRIPVDKDNVASFTLTLTDTEGEDAGLSEIEAFARATRQEGEFLKLMDMDGNFAYDYRTDRDGVAEFQIYTHGDLPEVTAENYSVNTAWDHGSAVLENGAVRVTCPTGESLVVNVVCNAAGVSDSITVRNPGRLERGWVDFWQKVEEKVFLAYTQNLQGKLLIPSTLKKISYVIRHLGE